MKHRIRTAGIGAVLALCACRSDRNEQTVTAAVRPQQAAPEAAPAQPSEATTLREFPPRQKSASWSLDQVLEAATRPRTEG